MKYINISIHDITKSNLPLVKDTVHFLRSIDIDKLTFLLIPKYHNIEVISEIIDDIRPIIQGGEVVLHGYTHLGKRFSPLSYRNIFTNTEGEFISFDDIYSRIINGLRIFAECNITARGFIPPAWLMRREDFNLLKKFNLRFTTDRIYIYDLEKDCRYFSPVLTFSSRKVIKQFSLLYFYTAGRLLKNINIVRVAIHPQDVKSNLKLSIIEDFINSNKDRNMVFLEEYLDEIYLIKNK